jgi:hypothetical protein
MKTIPTTLRPPAVAANSRPMALAALFAAFGLVLAGLSLLPGLVPTTPMTSPSPGLHPSVVDGAAASRLAAEHPWANVITRTATLVPSPGAYVFVDGATASRLAAEHPWTSGLPRLTVKTATGKPAVIIIRSDVRTSPRYVSVDGATASQLAAQHPWTPGETDEIGAMPKTNP